MDGSFYSKKLGKNNTVIKDDKLLTERKWLLKFIHEKAASLGG
jgi:hypothetical protein